MTTCNICIGETNKRNKIVTCIHCNFEACSTCCKRVILSSVNKAKCMNPDCGKVLNREFLVKNFTSSFVNKDYKNHKENVLYNQQLSMLPQTQNVAEDRIKIEKITDEVKDLKLQINTIKSKVYNLEQKKYSLKIGKKEEKVVKDKFFGHCPEIDCRGFITASHKCGICET